MRITELFDRGEFVVTAEVGPPKGIHVEHLVEEAKEYLSGITAVTLQIISLLLCVLVLWQLVKHSKMQG